MDCSLHNLMLPFFFFSIQASKVNDSFKVNKHGTLLGINGFGLRPGAIQSLMITCSSHTFKKQKTKVIFLLVQQFFSKSTLIFPPPETSCYHTGGHVSSLPERCPAWMDDFSGEVSSLSQV